MSVISDIIRGSGGHVTRTGYQFERIYIVSQLTGDAESILVNALLTPGVPRVGDAHPTIYYCYVEEVSVEPESSTIVRVRVVYKNPSPCVGVSGKTIEYNSNRSSKITDKDKDDKLIEVVYVAPPDSGPDDPKSGTHKLGEVDTPTTERTIVVTFITEDDPESDIDRYDNTVNSAGWHGEDARCWHCVASARSSNNGVTWEVRYEFYLNRKTWDRPVYLKGGNGNPAPGINDDDMNGRAIVRCIPEVNFMGLPFNI